MALFGGKLKQLARKLWSNITNQVPKGYIPIDVIGENGDSKAVRYLVSIDFLKCKGFSDLLDEYADEIRANNTGPIALPCSTAKFEEAIYRDRLYSRMHTKK